MTLLPVSQITSVSRPDISLCFRAGVNILLQDSAADLAKEDKASYKNLVNALNKDISAPDSANSKGPINGWWWYGSYQQYVGFAKSSLDGASIHFDSSLNAKSEPLSHVALKRAHDRLERAVGQLKVAKSYIDALNEPERQKEIDNYIKRTEEISDKLYSVIKNYITEDMPE
jgi:hypothetical protein